MGRFRTSISIYPWDLYDEGIPQALDEIQGRGGIDGVEVALAYHSGMFLLPHNPKRKLYFPGPSIYFRPEMSRYKGLKIQPTVHPLAEERVLEKSQAEASKRGMVLNGWVVCLHNSRIGTDHPDCNIISAFSDRHVPNLCPANPDVRAYVTALVTDVASRDVDAVLLESLEYGPFCHFGFHHEVAGIPLTPFISYLLGLCFCEHCSSLAITRGIDVKGLKRFVALEIQRFFDGDLDAGCEGIVWDEIKALARGDLGAFHEMRVEVVTSLFRQVRESLPNSSAVKLGSGDFGLLWGLGPDGTAWESGFDVARAGRFLDTVYPTPYFASLEAAKERMTQYHNIVPEGLDIIVPIRSIAPQVTKKEDLLPRLEACGLDKIQGFSFYNYGFMRLETLDWIREALEAIQGA